jgi:hypothetical protein
MPSVDEGLLTRTDLLPKKLSGPEQNFAARVLRRERARENRPAEVEESARIFGQVRVQTLKNKESAAEKIVGEVPDQATPASIATASLLKKSWFSAATVVGFVLGFLYINAHWLGNAILGKKFFCDLGEEWSLSKGSKNPSAELLKDKAKIIGLGEKGLIGLMDVIMLLVLLTIIFFLVT